MDVFGANSMSYLIAAIYAAYLPVFFVSRK
jgi:hypothetical protein